MTKMKALITTLLAFALVVVIASIAFAAGVAQNPANANQTGEDVANQGAKTDLNKNMSGNPTWADQSIHGNYQNNTNSCASCHKTHTGIGADLIFTSIQQDACYACHDGTVAPDLEAGSAGCMDGNTLPGYSQHIVDSSDAIKNAPGGNASATAGVTPGWGDMLGCASCHNVHGSDSYALLNTSISNLDGVSATVATVSSSVPATQGAEYILAWTTVNTSQLPWTKGYYYGLTQQGFAYTAADGTTAYGPKVTNGMQVLMTYRWDASQGKYVLDFPLWKSGSATPGVFQLDASTGTVIDYKHGLAYGGTAPTALAAGTAISLGIGISVQPYEEKIAGVQTTFNRSFFDDTYANYNEGSGRQLSLFCGQCHTDYVADYQLTVAKNSNAATAGVLDPTAGYGSKYMANVYRHTTDTDEFSCTRCHFAHGTSPTLMRDATGQNVADMVASGAAASTAAALNYIRIQTRMSPINVIPVCRYASLATAKIKQSRIA
jgi:predicted CXXCH cytochrome family protein